MSTRAIYNYRKVDDQFITGGQPTEEQLTAAANEGVKTVINLATFDPRSSLKDEASFVRGLGMSYYHIPVEWGNPKVTDFEAFESVMKQIGEGKALIHCAANFRVTAFFSLYAMKHLGWPEARADELRASIWRGSDYPVWDEFLHHMKTKINLQGPGGGENELTPSGSTHPSQSRHYRIVDLNFVSLYIKDFHEAINFYSQVFGPPEDVDGKGETYGWRMGATWLTVFPGKAGTSPDSNPRNTEFAIQVSTREEVDSLHQALIEAGAKTYMSPEDTTMYEPMRFSCVDDPFGVRIDIYCPAPPG